MKTCLKTVFAKKGYVALAVVIALVFFLATVFISNYSFLGYVLSSPKHSVLEKAMLFWTSIGYFETGFTRSSQIITILISLLAGLNVAMSVYYVRRKLSFDRSSGVGVLGLVSGVFGIGCSACGSVLFTSVFGLSATTALTTKLPLHGTEFGILGVLLLLASIWIVCEQIVNPKACAIKKPQ